jgi:exonuclease III
MELLNKILPLFVLMSISLASVNCNGLRNVSKLKKVFSHFQLNKFDIICLQETFWNDVFVNSTVKFNWDGDIFYSNFNGEYFSKGVAILFRHNLDCKIISVRELESGRILEAQIECDDNILYVYNVYAPNDYKDRVRLFKKMHNHICDNIGNNYYIICGDFNCITDTKDKSNNLYCDPSVEVFKKFMKEINIHDIWRKLHLIILNLRGVVLLIINLFKVVLTRSLFLISLPTMLSNVILNLLCGVTTTSCTLGWI